MREFEQVYRDYYKTVYASVLRLCKDPHFAEEVTQEAFFKALQSLDRFRGDCRLDVWLCKIARNTCLSMMKKRKRQTELPPADELPAKEDLVGKLEDRETALLVHKLLHELPEPYREIFWLRVFGELDFREIGALFQKSESWARVTFHRAKLKLQTRLEESK